MELAALIVLAAVLLAREWTFQRERSELLDRIQAPEQVIYKRYTENGETEEIQPPSFMPWGGKPE